ncbi:phospholipase D-like domain-containing protein [Halorussus pelagicus]|uniref:hypothetical protein n=1 Tax=Halorussus pelagicus TaxID=2505977 RepID=UPI000FFC1FDF|nr:hypothetical protein [Halorussus pelagicus]
MKLQQAFDERRRTFEGALLSTFVFNSDYFEGTLLPMLRRKSTKGDTVVFLDAGSYRETVSDEGLSPEQAGQVYYLAPVRVPQRRFHAKVFFFGGEERAIGFVGSANLTEAAFDHNQEIISKFDIANESDLRSTPEVQALNGIRRFYSDLIDHTTAEAIGKTAREQATRVLEATEWLTDTNTDIPDREQADEVVDVLHNLEQPLLDQVQRRIETRGERIQRVGIVAPFYGTGMAVPETVTEDNISTRVWLQHGSTQINSDTLQEWASQQEAAEIVVFDQDRYVHGKLIVLQSDTATYCLAGSAKASRSALLDSAGTATEGHGNVEVAVLRRTPKQDNYEYLFDNFTNHQLAGGLEEFTPQSTPDYQPPEPPEQETIGLQSIDFTRSEVFEGGRLHGHIQITDSVTNDDNLEIDVCPTTTTESFSFTFTGSELSPVTDSGTDLYTFSRRVSDSTRLAALSKPSQVVPKWNTEPGLERWLAIESRDVDRAAEAAAEGDGVDSVWRSVQDIFLGGDQQRTDQLEFLGTLATQLDQQTAQQGSHDQDKSTDSEADDENDGLSEGITLPSYAGSTNSRDPESQLSAYYEMWTDQLRQLNHELHSDDTATEHVIELAGQRLAAVNRTNAWLEITRNELQAQNKSLDSFPHELPRKYTKTLYSRTEPGFGDENGSLVAQFLRQATTLPNTEQVHAFLLENIAANVLFGALIADTLMTTEHNEFATYYGSDFENLIHKCLPNQQPLTNVSEQRINTLAESMWKQFGDLPETFQTASLTRRPPREFRKQRHARRYIMQFLHE